MFSRKNATQKILSILRYKREVIDFTSLLFLAKKE
nr:MAG TPA: hypothetical protein [Caudoviricetes sp.]